MMKPEFTKDPTVGRFLDDLKQSFTGAEGGHPYADVDKSSLRTNHTTMTDLTRQQVTDLLAASEAKMDARLANFDTSIKTGFADLRTEFAQVRAEMANDRTATSKLSNESQRWIVTAVAAMISIAVALIGVMINFSKTDKPAAVTPPPIVIYAQPATIAAPPEPPRVPGK